MKRLVNVLVAIAIPAVVLLAQTKTPRTVKRAQPPAKLKSDVFYADAFKEGLAAERPAAVGRR